MRIEGKEALYFLISRATRLFTPGRMDQRLDERPVSEVLLESVEVESPSATLTAQMNP
jgi:hypothetical protein